MQLCLPSAVARINAVWLVFDGCRRRLANSRTHADGTRRFHAQVRLAQNDVLAILPASVWTTTRAPATPGSVPRSSQQLEYSLPINSGNQMGSCGGV